jgi:membrane-associated protease RseP (regulator of RpoE activity)
LDPLYESPEDVPADPVWQPPRKFQDRVWLHILLLALTVVSTTVAGADQYLDFADNLITGSARISHVHALLGGLWYSGTILAILGAHELGHYFACRYYDVDASLPFFIPMPLVLTGTLGAVIRIREPIPSKRMLFDIGIAGPIAGFVLAVPALALGLWLSHVSLIPPNYVDDVLGAPLILQWLFWFFWGNPPAGYTLVVHPMVFAAWFGFLATALNLFPIGQLDGGHIAYAVLGRKSSTVTLVTVGIAIFLSLFVSVTWVVWTLVTIAMLLAFGRHHPRTFDEAMPLDGKRLLLAAFAVVMFILSFTPTPITPSQIIR